MTEPRPDLDRIRRAVSRLQAHLIASSHLLDVPFTNAPDQSPWTRIKADLTVLKEAVADAAKEATAEGDIP